MQAPTGRSPAVIERYNELASLEVTEATVFVCLFDRGVPASESKWRPKTAAMLVHYLTVKREKTFIAPEIL